MKEQLLERLIRYCKINTRSDAKSKTVPSTVRQFDLAKVLVEEAKSIGLEDNLNNVFSSRRRHTR